MEHPSTSMLLKRVYSEFIRQHLKKIIFAIICMAIVAAATAANAWLIKPVLDNIFVEQNASMLYVVPLILLVIAVVKAIAAYIETYILKSTSQTVVCAMQERLFAHLVHSDVALFHAHSAGSLISRFNYDTHVIRSNLVNVLIGGIREFLLAIALVGVMLYQSVTLSIMALIVLPIAVFPLIRLGKRMRKISRGIQSKMSDFTASLENSFLGIKVTKAFVKEAYEISRVGNTLDELLTLYKKAVRTEAITSPMMEMLGGIAVAAVIFYGGMQVLEGHTTPGAFFSFITALLMAYKPLKTLSTIHTRMQETTAALQRYYEIRDITPTVESSAAEIANNNIKIDGNIAIDGLSFSYHSDNAKGALHDISLQIKAGEKIAFVGKSGSGKSTLIQLLLKFYLPNTGSIAFNNHNSSTISNAQIRDNIAYVSQDAFLFEGSIKENIVYGNKEATERAIEECIAGAALHELITTNDAGIESNVGPGGSNLSGGQKQRIAIARALIKEAPILILDEATSALDSKTEAHILEHIRQSKKDQTVIAIAHRLSTISDMDCIYVMESGKIIESGTHNALLKQKGLYHSLWEQQSKKNEPHE